MSDSHDRAPAVPGIADDSLVVGELLTDDPAAVETVSIDIDAEFAATIASVNKVEPFVEHGVAFGRVEFFDHEGGAGVVYVHPEEVPGLFAQLIECCNLDVDAFLDELAARGLIDQDDEDAEEPLADSKLS